MPVTLSKIARNTATVTLSFGEDQLAIEYYPLRITSEMMSVIFDPSTTEQSIKAQLREYSETLASIIKSWDLLEDDGETPIALSTERIMQISPIIVLLVIRGIGADLRPEQIASQIQAPIQS
jgi:hypothetical protein